MLLTSKSKGTIKRDKQQDKAIRHHQIRTYKQDYKYNIDKLYLNDFTMHVLLRLYTHYNNHFKLPDVTSEYHLYIHQLFFLAKLGLISITHQNDNLHTVVLKLTPLSCKLLKQYFRPKQKLHRQFQYKDKLAKLCRQCLIIGFIFLILSILFHTLHITTFNVINLIIGIILTLGCILTGLGEQTFHDKMLDDNQITLNILLTFLKKNVNSTDYHQAQHILQNEYVHIMKYKEHHQIKQDNDASLSDHLPILIENQNS